MQLRDRKTERLCYQRGMYVSSCLLSTRSSDLPASRRWSSKTLHLLTPSAHEAAKLYNSCMYAATIICAAYLLLSLALSPSRLFAHRYWGRARPLPMSARQHTASLSTSSSTICSLDGHRAPFCTLLPPIEARCAIQLNTHKCTRSKKTAC